MKTKDFYNELKAQAQTQHNKTPQNVLITTDQKFIQTQQKQSKTNYDQIRNP